jgi:hypothetical protein
MWLFAQQPLQHILHACILLEMVSSWVSQVGTTHCSNQWQLCYSTCQLEHVGCHRLNHQ